MNEPDAPEDLVERFANAVLLHDMERAEEESGLRDELKARRVIPDVVVAAQPSETLARALRGGFFLTEVYNELSCRFEPRILSWLLRWGAEYHLAFDLTQAVLLHCLWERRLETYNQAQGGLAGYLKTAARNRLASHARRRSPSFVASPEDPAGGASPEEEQERAELEERVQGVLSKLPVNQRRVIELVLAGCTHVQIAQELRVEVSAVYGRLHRARMKLAELLGIVLPPTKRGRPRKPTDPPCLPA